MNTEYIITQEQVLRLWRLLNLIMTTAPAEDLVWTRYHLLVGILERVASDCNVQSGGTDD